MIHLMALVLLGTAVVTAQHPSPCPGVFKYLQDGTVEPGVWTGELSLTSEFPLAGVWIKLILDKNVDKIQSPFGEIVPREDKTYLIKSRDYNLVPGSVLTIPLTVKYAPGEPAPSLVTVRLNARTVCPAVDEVITAGPCPGVFTQHRDTPEPGRWHGSLTLQSEFTLVGIWLRVVLDRPAELLGNEFGEVRTSDNLDFLISNRNHTLEPGQSLKVSFWVKYNQDGPIPNIHTVRLNGRTICGQIISEDNNQ